MGVRLPVLYRNLTPLSQDRHRGWYLDTDQGFRFAREAQALPIGAVEFQRAARDYPIVFVRDAAGGLQPVVLLGLRAGCNAMVDERGRWTGGYLPAYLRRYPFMAVIDDPLANRYTVCIDETYSGFNTVVEGASLVDGNGQAGPAVRQCLEFLEEYHRQSRATAAFCAAVADADLLEAMQVSVKVESGEAFALNGFLCATRARIKALTPARLHTLVDQEYLELIYLHLHSLANVDRLVAKAGAANSPGA